MILSMRAKIFDSSKYSTYLDVNLEEIPKMILIFQMNCQLVENTLKSCSKMSPIIYET